MKYIDTEKLIAKIKELNLVTKTYDEQVAFNNALAMVVEIITSLQQEQPTIEEDWVEKRKQECGLRKLLANGNYQCERYEGNLGPCDGRCSWVIDYPKLKELEEWKQQEDNEDLWNAAEEFADKNVAKFSKTVKTYRDKEQKCLISHLTSGDWQQIKAICFRAFVNGFEWQTKQPEVDLEKVTKYSQIKELPDGFDKKWLEYYNLDSEYNSAKFHHLSNLEREYIIACHFYKLGKNSK